MDDLTITATLHTQARWNLGAMKKPSYLRETESLSLKIKMFEYVEGTGHPKNYSKNSWKGDAIKRRQSNRMLR